MPGQRIHIVMEPELIAAVDRAKGIGESRGHFVRRMLEQALEVGEKPEVAEAEGPGFTHVPALTRSAPAPARASRPVSDQQRWAMERQRKLNERKS